MNYWRCEACGRANKLDVLVCDGREEMSDNFQELDKCPFCGKEGEFLTFLVENNQWMVMCHNCGAIGPNEINPDRAVEMWNLRRPYSEQKAPE